MAGVFNIFLMVFLAIISLPISAGIPIPIYWLAVFFKAPARIPKAEKKLNDTLMKDEAVLDKGMQLRPFSFFSRRKLIAITNSRIILISRGLLGGFTMQDFQWKDLKDATVSENVLPNYCGSNLTFNASQRNISVPGIPSDTASSIYSKAQAEEQAWEEKHRVRGLEEKRAAAGGVTINSAPVNSNIETSSKSNLSAGEEIEKAKKLLESGAINDAEFQEIKSKILSKHF